MPQTRKYHCCPSELRRYCRKEVDEIGVEACFEWDNHSFDDIVLVGLLLPLSLLSNSRRSSVCKMRRSLFQCSVIAATTTRSSSSRHSSSLSIQFDFIPCSTLIMPNDNLMCSSNVEFTWDFFNDSALVFIALLIDVFAFVILHMDFEWNVCHAT